MTDKMELERREFEAKLKRRVFKLYKKHMTGRGYVWSVGCTMPDDMQAAVTEGMRQAFEDGVQAARRAQADKTDGGREG